MKNFFTLCVIIVCFQTYGQLFGPKFKLIDTDYFETKNGLFTDINGDGINELYASRNRLYRFERTYCDQLDSTGMSDLLIDAAYTVKMERVDMDGDGIEDLFSANSKNIYWIKVTLDGTLGDVSVINIGDDWILKVEVLDFDLDGDQDVLWFDGTLFLSENVGAGTFAAPVPVFGEMDFCYDLKSGDLNSDGLEDLVITSILGEFWLPHLGDGSYGTPQDILSIIGDLGLSGTQVEIHDIELDGDLDLALTGLGGYNEIGWVENDGLGNFIAWYDLSGLGDGNKKEYLKIADFDLDGLVDFVWDTHDIDALLQWRRNLGGGEFSDPMDLPFVLFDDYFFYPDVFSNFYLGDYDSDGDIDINMLFYFEDGHYVLENLSVDNSSIKGRIYIDLNENGINDEEEPGTAGFTVTLDGGDVRSYTNAEGFYQFRFCDYLAEDTLFEVFPVDLGYWNIVSDSLLYHAHVGSLLPPVDSLDFGIFPDTLADLIEVSLNGDYSSCVSSGTLWLDLSNFGTTYPSGLIHLTLDEELLYSSASVEPDSIIGQDVYWHYDSLPYFETYSIIVLVDVPGILVIGDTLHSTLIGTVDSLADEIYVEDEVWDIVACSYDPNRKTVTPAGLDTLGFISPTVTYLEYEIRFQNTGTDVAHNVMILDQLDENLDWSTFDFISASHAVEIEIGISGQLVLNYNDIMLPDSSVSATESIGYFKYGINLKPDVPIGTSIYNSAAIYFDANPPITTNQTISTIICSDFIDIDIAPFDKDTICIESIDEIELIASPFGGEFSGEGVEDDLFLPLLAGMGNHTIYYSITDEYGCVSVDSAAIYVTDCLGLQENEIYQIKVYPNPFDEFTTVYFGNNLTENHLILVHDLLGKEIYRNEAVSGEKFELRIDERGVYTVSLYSNFNASEIFTAKLVVE